jgi:hypothetical protein
VAAGAAGSLDKFPGRKKVPAFGVSQRLSCSPERAAPAMNSVEAAIATANSVNAFGTADVVFVAGGTNGYLLIDQNDSGTFGSPTDFAIVLQNVTSLSVSDIIAI